MLKIHWRFSARRVIFIFEKFDFLVVVGAVHVDCGQGREILLVIGAIGGFVVLHVLARQDSKWLCVKSSDTRSYAREKSGRTRDCALADSYRLSRRPSNPEPSRPISGAIRDGLCWAAKPSSEILKRPLESGSTSSRLARADSAPSKGAIAVGIHLQIVIVGVFAGFQIFALFGHFNFGQQRGFEDVANSLCYRAFS